MTRHLIWLWLIIVGVAACDDKPAEAGKPMGTAAGPVADVGAGAVVIPPPSVDAGASDAAAAVTGFKVGDKVSGKWTDGYWYPGKIAAVNPDGTYRVKYNDGDESRSLPASKVRARKASSSSGSTAGGCSGGRTTCGGRCVDLLNDNQNCHSCGRTCPEACMGGACVSNAYKYGP